jgi:DNA-binding CsgD family transcriptional regulator
MHELNLPAPVPRPQADGVAGAAALSACETRARMLERMLDIVDYGMLLLQPNGRVAFANPMARTELEQHPLLQLQGAALLVRDACDAAPLRDALACALHKGCQKMLTLGDEATQMLSIAIVPIFDDAGGGASGVMLVLGKRHVCDELSVEAFARQHRLTAAELRVLKLLCAGGRPSQIAGSVGVAMSTVRTQVASILEKTGLSGIGALLREVSRLPPMRSLLRAA